MKSDTAHNQLKTNRRQWTRRIPRESDGPFVFGIVAKANIGYDPRCKASVQLTIRAIGSESVIDTKVIPLSKDTVDFTCIFDAIAPGIPVNIDLILFAHDFEQDGEGTTAIVELLDIWSPWYERLYPKD